MGELLGLVRRGVERRRMAARERCVRAIVG